MGWEEGLGWIGLQLKHFLTTTISAGSEGEAEREVDSYKGGQRRLYSTTTVESYETTTTTTTHPNLPFH